MNDPEKFLTRWSRRKQDAAKSDSELEPERMEGAAPAEGEDKATEEGKSRVAALPNGEDAKPAFDLSKLPPIESIGATTDIRPFLASGVPAELTRAALRRAWLADPAIRDYIGLSENSWDFNDPHGALGFDLSPPTGEQLKRLVADVLGKDEPEEQKTEAKLEVADTQLSAPTVEESPAEAAETTPPSSHGKLKDESEGRDATEEKPVANQPAIAEHNERSAAPQYEDQVREASLPPRKRGHGRALPQ